MANISEYYGTVEFPQSAYDVMKELFDIAKDWEYCMTVDLDKEHMKKDITKIGHIPTYVASISGRGSWSAYCSFRKFFEHFEMDKIPTLANREDFRDICLRLDVDDYEQGNGVCENLVMVIKCLPEPKDGKFETVVTYKDVEEYANNAYTLREVFLWNQAYDTFTSYGIRCLLNNYDQYYQTMYPELEELFEEVEEALENDDLDRARELLGSQDIVDTDPSWGYELLIDTVINGKE